MFSESIEFSNRLLNAAVWRRVKKRAKHDCHESGLDRVYGRKGQLNEMGKKESCSEMVHRGLTDSPPHPQFPPQTCPGAGTKLPKHEGGNRLCAPWLSLIRWH